MVNSAVARQSLGGLRQWQSVVGLGAGCLGLFVRQRKAWCMAVPAGPAASLKLLV